jgi:hypothetical protein
MPAHSTGNTGNGLPVDQNDEVEPCSTTRRGEEPGPEHVGARVIEVPVASSLVESDWYAGLDSSEDSAHSSEDSSALEDYIAAMEKFQHDDTDIHSASRTMERNELPEFLRSGDDGMIDNQGTVEDILGFSVDEENGSELLLPNAMTSYAEVYSSYDLASFPLQTNFRHHGKGKRKKKLNTQERRLGKSMQRGFSIGYVDSILKEFVERNMDRYTLPPLSKTDQNLLRRLAGLYKIRSTESKISRKRILISLWATPQTALPTGEDEIERVRLFARERAAFERLKHGAPQVGHQSPKDRSTGTSAGFRRAGPPPLMQKRETVFVSDGNIGFDDDTFGRARPKATEAQVTFDGCPALEGQDDQLQSKVASLSVAAESHAAKESTTKPVAMMTKQEAKKLAKKRAKENRRAEMKGSVQVEQIGAFEKHTTGIGSKLLSKWGFEKGSGLGKREDGIAVPIRTTIRGKHVGLGAE